MADLYTPRTKDKLKRIALAQRDGILLPQVAADQQRQIIRDFESRPKVRPPFQRQLPSHQSKKQRKSSTDVASRGRARVASARARQPARNASDRRPDVADAGRRRTTSKLPADARGLQCATCAPKLRNLQDLLLAEGCHRTAQELKHAKDKDMVFNLQRLKLSLAVNCFDLQGNYAVHAGCLVELLGVSPAYLASLHACVIDQKRAPIYQKPKGEITGRLLGQVIVPSSYTGPGGQRGYVKSLPEGAAVNLRRLALAHGLSGKASNFGKQYELARELFIQFVINNRSSTGRTLQPDGRYHGAEYYLSPAWTQERWRVESDRQHQNGDPDMCFSFVVRRELQNGIDALKAQGDSRAAKAKVPCHKICCQWLKKDFFGIGAERGHTVIQKCKTDYCDKCSSLEEDLRGLTKSLKKHRSCAEQDEKRKERIATLQQDIKQLKDSKQEHRAEAAAAQKAYNDANAVAREQYQARIEALNELRRRKQAGLPPRRGREASSRATHRSYAQARR